MIKDNLQKILSEIPKHVQLIAVSKTKPINDILQAYEIGQRHFGENKVQELNLKQAQLPSDIYWHMIGHLQTNKVKYIAPYVHLIHGVDSLKLLKEINKQAKKNNRTINCLLQFHIASESSKFGLSLAEARNILKDESFNDFTNICLKGVMGMASFTTDQNTIDKEFSELKSIFDSIKEIVSNKTSFDCISMGMSGDYKIAIENGSNMIRIGSTIFGNR
tara:strand:- start:629 stop:1285 length:657 start_codon:yes stop_codon:yes gene_type:complete